MRLTPTFYTALNHLEKLKTNKTFFIKLTQKNTHKTLDKMAEALNLLQASVNNNETDMLLIKHPGNGFGLYSEVCMPPEINYNQKCQIKRRLSGECHDDAKHLVYFRPTREWLYLCPTCTMDGL